MHKIVILFIKKRSKSASHLVLNVTWAWHPHLSLFCPHSICVPSPTAHALYSFSVWNVATLSLAWRRQTLESLVIQWGSESLSVHYSLHKSLDSFILSIGKYRKYFFSNPFINITKTQRHRNISTGFISTCSWDWHHLLNLFKIWKGALTSSRQQLSRSQANA